MGAVLMLGLFEGVKGVNWRVFLRTFLGWVLTLVVAAFVACGLTAFVLYAPQKTATDDIRKASVSMGRSAVAMMSQLRTAPGIAAPAWQVSPLVWACVWADESPVMCEAWLLACCSVICMLHPLWPVQLPFCLRTSPVLPCACGGLVHTGLVWLSSRMPRLAWWTRTCWSSREHVRTNTHGSRQSPVWELTSVGLTAIWTIRLLHDM